MEPYELHIAAAADHNLRMMGEADRALETDNLEDLRGLVREMRMHGKQIEYELGAVLELVGSHELKRKVEEVMHLIGMAVREAGRAMNEADPESIRNRASEVHRLGEQAEVLLNEAVALSGT